ncbi:MAG TPA: hypothetical protein VK928_01955 [Longimicrobiales bacterium]|nr:hypothetical protein [Longimicrobiales bacterium]
MTWEQPILLVAIAVTFILWRRARARSERFRAELTSRLEGVTYTLDAREDDNGRGFAIVDADGAELAPESLDWQVHGLAVIAMHSVAHDLAPGTALLLEPSAAVAGIEVIVEETGESCGAVTGPAGAAVRSWLEAGEVASAMVLWQAHAHDVLPRISILLFHRDVALDA